MKKFKPERVAAILGIVVLIGMYVALFISAVLAGPYTKQIFLGCLLSTVFIPIFLHVIVRLFVHMSKKSEGEYSLHDLHKMKKSEKTSENENE